MSRPVYTNKSNNNSNNNAVRRVPFCKVCADAGKSDTAHYPRKTPDPNSQVVCPTLLALECRYCFKNGHTVKYCTVLKDRQKLDDDHRRQQERYNRSIEKERNMEKQRLAEAEVANKKMTGRFNLLLEDDEEEQEQAQVTQALQTLDEQFIAVQSSNEFPPLASCGSTGRSVTTWATMAANVAHLPIPVKATPVKATPVKVTPVVKPAPVVKTTSNRNSNIRWADDDYDEDDYDSIDHDIYLEQQAFEQAPSQQTYLQYLLDGNDDGAW
jgi:hypothetical protein